MKVLTPQRLLELLCEDQVPFASGQMEEVKEADAIIPIVCI